MDRTDGEAGRDIAAAKRELRRTMSALRDRMPEGERRIRSEAACAHAAAWLAQRGLGSFMAYAPLRSELDTGPLLEWGWRSGAAVILPRSNPADRTMTLYRVRGWAELAAGAYGILEPAPDAAERWTGVPGAVFAPGLAFDRHGGRLGYGGGYYDRFRARLAGEQSGGSLTPWIGLAFRAQIIPLVPTERHDAPLDGLITEGGFEYRKRRETEWNRV